MAKLVGPPAHPVYTGSVDSAYRTRMYQSIDDETEAGPTRAGGLAAPLAWAGLAVMAGFAAVFLFSPDGRVGTVDPLTPEPEARRAYLRALGETDPALRRARLTDFVNQHSQNPRADAARAQLSVLDRVADADWMDVLTVAQDPTQTIEERRAAVLAYREVWGRYLGSRDAEIDALLADIEATPADAPTPNRNLPDTPGEYPGVPDDRLVGGPTGVSPPVTYRPSPPPRTRKPDGVVVLARVVRDMKPRYPRSALRRGVGGRVTLSLSIDAEGRVAMAEVISVEADRYGEDFVKAAERAALRTRFRPQTVGGQPVPVSGVHRTYRFEPE